MGEALLARGRFPTKDGDAPNVPWTQADVAPIARWMKSADPQVRWRVAWALFRPRDPLATPYEMTLSTDAHPEVRFWSMRGLTALVVGQSTVSKADTSARLRQAMGDPDRRVRTEATLALGGFDPTTRAGYDVEESVMALARALESDDTWMSVAAARALARHTSHAAALAPRLTAAATAGKPVALRIDLLPALVAMAPDAARTVATDLATLDNTTAKTRAATAMRQLDAAAAAAAAGTPAIPAAGRTGDGDLDVVGDAVAAEGVMARRDADDAAERTHVPAVGGARVEVAGVAHSGITGPRVLASGVDAPAAAHSAAHSAASGARVGAGVGAGVALAPVGQSHHRLSTTRGEDSEGEQGRAQRG